MTHEISYYVISIIRKKKSYAGYLAHYMFLKYIRSEGLDCLDEFFKITTKTTYFPEEVISEDEESDKDMLSEMDEDSDTN
jgi:hypothetical protein